MRWTHDRVQARLPRLVDGALPRWRQRLLERHLDRCGACAAELERQRTVAEGLAELGAAERRRRPEPPEELLDAILERVNDPGIRERVAAPARGAVSGARPELSVAAVLLSLLVLYLVWRLARVLAERLHGREGRSLGDLVSELLARAPCEDDDTPRPVR